MRKMMKFGGSSLANAERIHAVYEILRSEVQAGHEVAVVVSAIQGITNDLLSLCEQAADRTGLLNRIILRHTDLVTELGLSEDRELHGRIKALNAGIRELMVDGPETQLHQMEWQDEVLSLGERYSATIISHYLSSLGLPGRFIDSRDLVLTDNSFGHAYVHYQQSYDRVRQAIPDLGAIPVITGFLGATESGQTTTLGRSGSDYSAAIFGAALNVDEVHIWTDVNGILTTHPDWVPSAHTIPELSYEEAMELAHAGAKVVFPPTMIPLQYKGIPIVIKNSYAPEEDGTRIVREREVGDDVIVGISSLRHVSLIRLSGPGMVGVRGINARLFNCLAEAGISIMLVSQAFSEHSTCFALQPQETDLAIEAVEAEFARELRFKYIDTVRAERDMSLVAVVGEGMLTTPGMAGRVFDLLGEQAINVEAIAQGATRRNISFVVRDEDLVRAVNILHAGLFGRN